MEFSVAPELVPPAQAGSFFQVSPSLPCERQVGLLEEKPATGREPLVPTYCPQELHTPQPAHFSLQQFVSFLLDLSTYFHGITGWLLHPVSKCSVLCLQKYLSLSPNFEMVVCPANQFSVISSLSRLFLLSEGGCLGSFLHL